MANINQRFKVLLRWINIFKLPQKASRVNDLKDGIIVLKILEYLAPSYFISPKPGASLLTKDTNKRFELIMTGLERFCIFNLVVRIG